jgi:hypothetical protein
MKIGHQHRESRGVAFDGRAALRRAAFAAVSVQLFAALQLGAKQLQKSAIELAPSASRAADKRAIQVGQPSRHRRNACLLARIKQHNLIDIQFDGSLAIGPYKKEQVIHPIAGG